jgi:hypothetical protein
MRAGERLWTEKDDSDLREEVKAGAELDDIAKKIGRTPSAIRNRAYILRLTLGKPRLQQRAPARKAHRLE